MHHTVNFTTQIRSMTANDLPSVIKLAEQLGYPVSIGSLTEHFIRVSSESDHALFVIENQTRVLGYAHVFKYYSLTRGPNAQLAAIVVDEACRGQGLGKSLMAKVELWSLSKGLGSVWLSTQTKRETAHRFYQGLGYGKQKSSFVFGKNLSLEK